MHIAEDLDRLCQDKVAESPLPQCQSTQEAHAPGIHASPEKIQIKRNYVGKNHFLKVLRNNHINLKTHNINCTTVYDIENTSHNVQEK